MSKTKLYEDLHDRMTQAKNSQYYLESCWIAYGIIEDRLNSTIRHAYDRGEELLETMRGMQRKIDHIKEKIHPNDHDCVKTVHKYLLGEIEDWKYRRNDLMHEIAEEASFEEVQSKTRSLAREGVDLDDDITNRVRKYKEKVRNRSN